ncbi:MAG: phosphate ABC transporter substrate-binding protein PstS [Microthrixaceae bacterium]
MSDRGDNLVSRRRAALRILAVVVPLAVTTACGPSAANSGEIDLPGAMRERIEALESRIVGGGASFPDAFYQAVNTDFNKIAGGELVTYAKSGSADGRNQLNSGTLDFAGSDSLPKADEQLPEDLLFFPTVAAPITISYNLSSVDELALGPLTLAAIFQADITRWNAPEIAADNPGVSLPDLPITVVHRSDGSGTTKNFTSYLGSAAPGLWRLGVGDEVAWPSVTQGAEKNSGVAEVIKKTSGSIGYVDLGDAAKAGLSIARVQNSAGHYMLPTAEAVELALEGADVAADLTFNPLNSPGEGAYPITAPTWILVSARNAPDEVESLRAYLEYLLGPAQSQALALGYVPLPKSLAEKAIAQIDRLHS